METQKNYKIKYHKLQNKFTNSCLEGKKVNLYLDKLET